MLSFSSYYPFLEEQARKVTLDIQNSSKCDRNHLFYVIGNKKILKKGMLISF